MIPIPSLGGWSFRPICKCVIVSSPHGPARATHAEARATLRTRGGGSTVTGGGRQAGGGRSRGSGEPPVHAPAPAVKGTERPARPYILYGDGRRRGGRAGGTPGTTSGTPPRALATEPGPQDYRGPGPDRPGAAVKGLWVRGRAWGPRICAQVSSVSTFVVDTLWGTKVRGWAGRDGKRVRQGREGVRGAPRGAGRAPRARTFFPYILPIHFVQGSTSPYIFPVHLAQGSTVSTI